MTGRPSDEPVLGNLTVHYVDGTTEVVTTSAKDAAEAEDAVTKNVSFKIAVYADSGPRFGQQTATLTVGRGTVRSLTWRP